MAKNYGTGLIFSLYHASAAFVLIFALHVAAVFILSNRAGNFQQPVGPSARLYVLEGITDYGSSLLSLDDPTGFSIPGPFCATALLWTNHLPLPRHEEFTEDTTFTVDHLKVLVTIDRHLPASEKAVVAESQLIAELSPPPDVRAGLPPFLVEPKREGYVEAIGPLRQRGPIFVPPPLPGGRYSHPPVQVQVVVSPFGTVLGALPIDVGVDDEEFSTKLIQWVRKLKFLPRPENGNEVGFIIVDCW